VARLRLRHSQPWRLLQGLPAQSIMMLITLHLGRWCCLSRWAPGVRPVRTTGQAIQRDHWCGVSCPRRTS